VPPKDKIGEKGCPVEVRFLGLFDTVASFGIPGNSINVGHHLSVPKIVKNVRHAVAADEKRSMFPLNSLNDSANSRNTLVEQAFPGAHSDIGGGYADGDLSNIPLKWMWYEGIMAGVPFGLLDPEDIGVRQPKYHDERFFWQKWFNKPRVVYNQ